MKRCPEACPLPVRSGQKTICRKACPSHGVQGLSASLQALALPSFIQYQGHSLVLVSCQGGSFHTAIQETRKCKGYRPCTPRPERGPLAARSGGGWPPPIVSCNHRTLPVQGGVAAVFVVRPLTGAFVSVPNFFMLQWIVNLFADHEASSEEMPVIHRITRGDIRLVVTEYRKKCGHPGYLFEMYLNIDNRDRWELVAFLGSESVQDAIILLQEASEFIAGRDGVKPLPTVRVFGKSYFVDERLNEARNVDDPADRFELCPLD